MGWFDSEEVVTVGTSVSRAIQDDMLPNSVRDGIFKEILSGGDEGSLSDAVMGRLSDNIVVKADRAYRYAEDKYVFGRPSAKFYNSNAGQEVVTELMATLEGTPIDVDYYHFGAFNYFHYGWKTLVDSYGYDRQTNELKVLSAQKGAPVYLKDMVVFMSETAYEQKSKVTLEQWGDDPTSGYTPERVLGTTLQSVETASTPALVIDPYNRGNYIKVTYIWSAGGNQTAFFNLPLDGISNVGAQYFQVKYACWDANGKKLHRYFTYQKGLGTYPQLDALFQTTPSELGTYFPFLHFRRDKQDLASNQNSEVFKSSKKLAKFFGLDFAEVSDSIHQNPGIGDVVSAMMIMAVPANTSNPVEQKYLFHLFKKIAEEAGTDISTPQNDAYSASPNFGSAWSRLLRRNASKFSYTIRDKTFEMSMSMQNLSLRWVAGTIGKVGTYTGGYGSFTTPQEVQEQDEFGELFSVIRDITTREHYYRYQATPGFYQEVRIPGLEVRYVVSGDHLTTASASETHLLIPVDYEITRDFSNPEREELYCRGLHFVFNSMIVTEVEWYEQQWFADVLMVIAIIITIVTLGQGYQAIIAAAAISATAVALLILDYVITMVIYAVAFKLAVRILGPEFALLLAVIALAVGAYGASSSGIQNAPWASELLIVSSGLANAASAQIGKDMLSLQNDYTDFINEKEVLNKQLETAQKILETSNPVSPFIVFGESPKDYYQRTVHSGNIGVIAIEAISNYADIALRLPKIYETIGDFNA